ncbi:hypothetical protein B5F40_06100 [Gordonibacter sp. An230]|uniref:hypothetical protein n=1 Tax=Gordonibacter sp. An230 TaxID=1965592 RepID=UPI000B38F02A|nr:hypothetical protein [Gordonibacter sp. An230]OUO90757.1 hypothetical protein B5F40_06100 [Gordonibacter sp. An230]
MNKKMRAFAWAAATALALAPFLGGCAADGADAQRGAAVETQRQDAGDAIGEDGEVVRFGLVTSVEGENVVIAMGELGSSFESGRKTFGIGKGEVALSTSEVRVVDESGSAVEGRALQVDDVVAMRGASEGSSFKPQMVEILDVACSGANADDGRVPQAG